MKKHTQYLTLLFVMSFIVKNNYSQAQTISNYTFTTATNASLTDVSVGASTLISTSQNDVVSSLTDIGFDFWFFGQKFTTFSASDNGLIRLGGLVNTTRYDLANSTSYYLAPFASNQKTSASGSISYLLSGTAPNRCLTISFNNMGITNSSASADGTYQTRLYETSNIIEYVYGTMSIGATTATVYIGLLEALNSPSTRTTIVTSTNTSSTSTNSNSYSSTGAITNLNSASNGSRRIYTYTPTGTTAPASFTATRNSNTQIDLSWSDGSNEIAYEIYYSTSSTISLTTGGPVALSTLVSTAANATSTSITGLSSNTTYYFVIFAIREGFSSGSTANASTAAPPSVSTSAVSSISITTATGNGTISSIGGSAISVSGVCWNTSTGPTTANSKTTDGPTTATTITSSITGLTAETYYYLKAYATNTQGTAYGTEVNFYTLSTEPTGHSAIFTATLNGNTQIDLVFSAASGYGADGYILLRRTNSSVTSGGVSDGTAPGALSLTDATLVTTITSNATTSYSNTGLSAGITYYYMLIPYNYDASHSATYNYYIAGTIPTSNAMTPESYSTKGIVIAGNFTNNGTFIQTSDANYFAMSGTTKSLTGSGTYTNAKAYINGTITYDGTSTSDMTKTLINTTKTFTISNNKTYYNASMTINGTLVISATTSEIKNSGNWINNGNFTANTTSLVTFTGASGTTQTIGGTTTSNFYNATMSNTSGGVTLGIATTISKTLTLNSGKLYTAGYTLTLGTTSANGSVSGGGPTTYVVAYDNSGTIGYLKQFVNSNAAYTYPIGDASYYTPLTFTLTSNASLTNAYYTVYTKPVKVPGLNTAFTTYLTRFWEGTSSGMTTPVYSLSYTYDDTDVVGTEANLLPIKKSGTTWYKPTVSTFTTGTAQGTGSVTTGTNTLTWTGLSTFSYNGGAGTQATGLPIQLTSFTGEKEGVSNILKWNTSSEINNDYFTIEKTIDGSTFEIIGTLNGAGNSSVQNNYQLYDYNFQKTINYYRLKQTDFDGNSTYAQEVSIDNRENESDLKTIVLITNILGQEVNETYKGLIIISYSDGSSMKVIR